MLTKNRLGYIWGDFLTISSGHPGSGGGRLFYKTRLKRACHFEHPKRGQNALEMAVEREREEFSGTFEHRNPSTRRSMLKKRAICFSSDLQPILCYQGRFC
jgi:hypothetical protein